MEDDCVSCIQTNKDALPSTTTAATGHIPSTAHQPHCRNEIIPLSRTLSLSGKLDQLALLIDTTENRELWHHLHS